MTPTIEDAIEIIRQLPLADREKLREWIHEENQKEQTETERKKAELEEKTRNFRTRCNGSKNTKKNMTVNGLFWMAINLFHMAQMQKPSMMKPEQKELKHLF